MHPPRDFLRRVKDYGLPIAMTAGILCWKPLSYLESTVPYLIFGMLFMTFMKLRIKDMRFSMYHVLMFAIQFVLAVSSYYLLVSFDKPLASGTMICFLCPAATASAVIIGMLGGSIEFSTPYVLLSHIALALIAPILFTVMHAAEGSIAFWPTVWHISYGVIPLVTLPLIAAQLLRVSFPKVHQKLVTVPQVAFYLWIVTLAIILAKTMKYVMAQPRDNIHTEILLAAGGLAACVIQFAIGKLLGKKLQGESITMGQALGQKNTSLAIWIALSYLNPISSIAPASYVIWQNTLNSVQLWLANRKADKNKIS